MAQLWKTVRVFISSTFRDMHAERDHLINEVFVELRDWCAKRRLHLVDVDLRWGVTEEEEKKGKVLEICLDEIGRCRPFFIGLLGERYGWTPPEYNVSDEPQYDWVRKFDKGHSVTALEIYHGVLRGEEMKARAFFYFRDPQFINDVPEKYRADFQAESDDAKEKLEKLKSEVKEKYPVLENYPCQFDGVERDEKVSLIGLEEFGNRVLEDLKAAILAEYPEDAPQPDEIEIERAFHETFIENSTKRFIGRDTFLNQLNEYAKSESTMPLVVTGKPGCGKSALLAKLAKEFAEKHADTFILSHFIGVSPGSTDIRRTMLRLCRELKQKFNLAEDIPTDYYELRQAFPKFLECATANGKVLLILDALNQLDESHYSHTVEWLPQTFPQGLKVIVSAIDESDCLVSLRRRKPALQEVVIGSLEKDEQKEIVRQTLDDYRKKLDERPENDQMELLLSKTESDNPLYLIVACEEMRVFGVFELVTEKIKTLAETVEGLFVQVLERLETTHDKTLVKDALSFLECSRHGLLEGEMLELLAPFGEKQLPQAVWSRLYWSLKPYLRPPGEDGEGLLDFFHRQLSKAVREKYLHNEGDEIPYHQHLAKFFKVKTDPNDDKSWTGNYPRGLSELAHHLLEGEMRDDLFQIARDETFLQEQANAFSDEPEIQLETLQKAITAAAQIDDAAKMAEFVLSHARRVQSMQDESPLDALRKGNLERAWKLADLYDIERCVLWYLLFAWELKDRGQIEQARETLEFLKRKEMPELNEWKSKAAVMLLSQLVEVAEDLSSISEILLHEKERVVLSTKLAVLGELTTAKAITQKITSDESRDYALSELANMYIPLMDFEAALEIAQQITEGSVFKYMILREIVRKTAQSSDFNLAMKTSRQIDNESQKAYALCDIAAAQMQVGDAVSARDIFTTAVATAQQIENAASRAICLREVAVKNSHTGENEVTQDIFTEALNVAFELDYEEEREKECAEIAKAAGKVGCYSVAISATRDYVNDRAYKAEALGEIAKAMGRAGEMNAAQNIFAESIRIAISSPDLLKEIVISQAELGYFAEAFETTRLIKLEWWQNTDKVCAVKADALRAIAKAQAQAREVVAARNTFVEAIETSRLIDAQSKKATVLKEIGEAQLQFGEIDDARSTFAETIETTRLIDEDFKRTRIFEDIAKAWAEAGDFNEAFETAKLIKGSKARAFEKIAKAQMHARTFSKALKTARLIDVDWIRTETIAQIAIAQAEADFFAEAIETAKLFDNGSEMAPVLCAIAQVMVEKKEMETARNTIARAITVVNLRLCEQINNALCDIAKSQLQVKCFDDALKTSKIIEDEFSRAEILLEIGEAQIKEGDLSDGHKKLAEAIIIAQLLEDDLGRTQILTETSNAQIIVGEVILAKETLTQAVKAAMRIDVNWKRTGELEKILKIQIKIGAYAEAIETAHKISQDWNKAIALREIGEVLAQNREADFAQNTFNEAINAVMLFDEKWKKPIELEKIARAQIQVGAFSEALETAMLIDVETLRSILLTDIAKAHAEIGQYTIAVKIAMQIEEVFPRGQLLCELAEGQAMVGIFDSAIETAFTIGIVQLKSRALANVARMQAQAGAFVDAFNTAMIIDVEWARTQAMEEITKAQKQSASKQKTDVVMTNDSPNIFAAEIEKARLITDEFKRAEVLKEVGEAQVKAGEIGDAHNTFAEAIESVKEHGNVLNKAELIAQIAISQSRAGIFVEAIKTAQLCDQPNSRVIALKEIGKAQMQIGLISDARITFIDALETAHLIGDEWNESQAVRSIAKTQAEVGNYAEAIETATTVKVEQLKVEAFADIAEVLLEAGSIDIANNIIVNAIKSERGMKVLTEISKAQAKAGLTQQAFLTSQKIMIGGDQLFPEIAAIFVETENKDGFKKIMTPCAYYLYAAYRMCGMLARLYPEQANAIAKIVSSES